MSRAQSSAFEIQRSRLTGSAEARLLIRPAVAYRALTAKSTEGRPAATWHWLARPAFLALMLGAFVSFTTVGRLTARLVLIEAVFWSVIPLLQILVAISVLRILGRRHRLASDLDFFFLGNGIWHLWLLGISGLCLILGPIRDPLWPIDRFALLATFVITLIWVTRIRFAFFYDALRLPARQALAALAIYNAGFWGVIVGYGALSGQLLPRLARYWSF